MSCFGLYCNSTGGARGVSLFKIKAGKHPFATNKACIHIRYLSHLNSIGSDSPDDRSMGKFLSWYLHKEER